jgi:hypothetical protein
MSYKYGLKFGSGDSRNFSGLSPTFIIFKREDGTDESAPAITEVGSSTGLYYFNYEPSPTFTVFFQVDGGSSVTDSSVRYISGTLDPIASVDRYVGFPQDSYGTTASPSTVFGFAKRINELWQADGSFSKTTGLWNQYAKGTSTLLFSKTLANSSAQVVKT